MPVRKAVPSDIDGIIEVLKGYRMQFLRPEDKVMIDERFGDVVSVYNEISELAWERSWVAEHDGKVVGFCNWKPYGVVQDRPAAKTTLISVLPDYRKHGYGKELLTARMREAREV